MDSGFADLQEENELLRDQLGDLETELATSDAQVVELRAEMAAQERDYEAELEDAAAKLRWLEAQHRHCPKPVRKSSGGFVWSWNGTEWQMSGEAS